MIIHPGHEQTVILTVGLPGSGKTKFSKEVINSSPPCWRHISRDDLRDMLLVRTDSYNEGHFGNDTWTPRKEQQVIQARDALLRRFLQEGCCVVVDETFLNPKVLAHVRAIIGEFPTVKIEEKVFTVDVDVCVERDIHRGARAVGAGVIRSMARQWFRDPAPLVVAGAPEAIICDLDGTLALFPGENPYDRDFTRDLLNEPVARILQRFRTANVHIVITSGRKGVAREDTIFWLEKNAIPYDGLIMRTPGDDRKDNIVKREFYDEHIKGKYNVLFVLDDRDQVVDMWRGLGLTCLQVEYGSF